MKLVKKSAMERELEQILYVELLGSLDDAIEKLKFDPKFRPEVNALRQLRNKADSVVKSVERKFG